MQLVIAEDLAQPARLQRRVRQHRGRIGTRSVRRSDRPNVAGGSRTQLSSEAVAVCPRRASSCCAG